MIGRVYTWRAAFWQVQVRWAHVPGAKVVRNVLIERVLPVTFGAEHAPGDVQDPHGRWWRPTGERIVRPFRGLRKTA